MSALVVSDTHFTENPRDNYRWELFNWLKQKVSELNVQEVIHCGDACDSKDRHPSSLVNRFCDELVDLSTKCRITLLAGNHDYIDPTLPFFNFTRHLDIEFIKEPKDCYSSIGDCLFLPSTKNWKTDWDGIINNKYNYIFTHATFDGCKIENGRTLNGGIPPSVFANFDGKVFSGDIHVPQKLGRNIEYVGAPYHINFGDSFNPRVLFLSDDKQLDLTFDCINKYTISIGNMDDLIRETKITKLNDQVKVRVLLKRSDLPNWKNFKQQIKEFCAGKNFQLFGPELVITTENRSILDDATVTTDSNSGDNNNNSYNTPEKIVEIFAKKNRLSNEARDIGLSIIDGLLGGL